MLGAIYAADGQRCPICGGKFLDDNKRSVSCPEHPGQIATKLQVRFRSICKRFNDYRTARRFLTGLRYKCDEGSFDERDYMANKPLGFSALAEKWLDTKSQNVKPNTYRNLRNEMRKAIEFWGHTHIREIGYAEIEDFLLAQEVSQKTRHNIRSCLHDFWTWLRKRQILGLHEMPEFPEVKFELRFRKTIEKETQGAILEEVHRLSHHINPKIWLGIKWLCTYISLRPGELIGIREEHIDLENGYLIIPSPKEKKPKLIPLIGEDIELILSLPRGMPRLHFFRHVKGNGAAKPGQKFGKDLLYVWWKRACKNLGIKGVDLYGGTRHSSAIALRKYRTPEEIKRATMHSTNKAFERYFRIEGEELRSVYADTRPDKVPIKKNGPPGRAKVLKFKD